MDFALSPQAAAAYWKAVADFIAGAVNDADSYLIEDPSALDEESKAEIYNALVQARVAADTAYGAYSRVASAERANAARHASNYTHEQMNGQYQQVRGYAQSAQWGW